MQPLLLNLDLGTTNCKAVVFTAEGVQVTAISREHPTYHPRPDWAEQDPAEWWKAALAVITEAVSRTQEQGRLVAMTVTSQREGIVPVGPGCEPLSHCIIWMDKRTGPQAEELERRLGRERVHLLTGLRIDPAFSAAKILWIARNQPEAFAAAEKFLQPGDFLLAKLSGKYVTDQSISSRTMLMNVRERKWEPELLEAVGLTASRMPDLVAPGTPIGPVLAVIAQVTGLPSDCLVCAGAGDQQAGALGAGAISQDIVACSIGTASVIAVTTPQPILDDSQTMICGCSAIPGKWLLEPALWTTGSVLRWFRDELACPEVAEARLRGVDPYEVITELAASVPPGAEGVKVIPHFMGAGSPHWVPEARGVVFGLSLGHTRAHLARAIMEGVAFELVANLELARKLGIRTREVRMLGGGAYSPLWRQILASAAGLPVALPGTAEAVSLGGAILGATAAGLYGAVEEAAAAMGKVQETTQPDPAQQAVYKREFAVYMDLMRTLTPAFIKAFRNQ